LVGPWFGYRIDDDQAWLLTADRFWLTTLPAVAVVVGGIVLLISKDRLSAAMATWLAIAGGAWFAVGPSVSALWSSTLSATGVGRGTTVQRLVGQLASFSALGVAIVGLASFALARVLVRSQRDAEWLQHEVIRRREEQQLAEAWEADRARANLERDRAELRAGATRMEGLPVNDPAATDPPPVRPMSADPAGMDHPAAPPTSGPDDGDHPDDGDSATVGHRRVRHDDQP
jgi:hypothetical protein